MHHILGRFGYGEDKYHPCTFGMNDKGGMNTDEFEDYMKNSLVTLFPHAADRPGRRVLLKADGVDLKLLLLVKDSTPKTDPLVLSFP
jgi:hypothetical protein